MSRSVGWIADERLQIDLKFGKPGTGVPIRTSDLGRSRYVTAPETVRIVTLRDVGADVILADAPEPPRAVSAAVALRLQTCGR